MLYMLTLLRQLALCSIMVSSTCLQSLLLSLHDTPVTRGPIKVFHSLAVLFYCEEIFLDKIRHLCVQISQLETTTTLMSCTLQSSLHSTIRLGECQTPWDTLPSPQSLVCPWSSVPGPRVPCLDLPLLDSILILHPLVPSRIRFPDIITFYL